MGKRHKALLELIALHLAGAAVMWWLVNMPKRANEATLEEHLRGACYCPSGSPCGEPLKECSRDD